MMLSMSLVDWMVVFTYPGRVMAVGRYSEFYALKQLGLQPIETSVILPGRTRAQRILRWKPAETRRHHDSKLPRSGFVQRSWTFVPSWMS